MIGNRPMQDRPKAEEFDIGAPLPRCERFEAAGGGIKLVNKV
jgi:hypothetical protein